jgi:chemotaxis protein MotB
MHLRSPLRTPIGRGARPLAALLVAMLPMAGLLAAGAGCGYTTEEYHAQADKLTRALAKQRDADRRAEEMSAELEQARLRVTDLEERLRAMGMDLEAKDGRIGDLSATLAERERALAEFRARARQLEEMKARMELLKSKLDELIKVGIDVRVRRNRLVISLPGNVLFDTNKDKIRKDGREALKKIAEVIKNDPSLVSREYQVGGHTDNKVLKGGAFGDNMNLSLARARAVHTFLTSPEGGGLPKEKWSAAGFADADPIATNDTEEGRQANRRTEIVVVPALAELLDLRQLAAPSTPAGPAKKNAEPTTP